MYACTILITKLLYQMITHIKLMQYFKSTVKSSPYLVPQSRSGLNLSRLYKEASSFSFQIFSLEQFSEYDLVPFFFQFFRPSTNSAKVIYISIVESRTCGNKTQIYVPKNDRLFADMKFNSCLQQNTLNLHILLQNVL